nr:piggyBac transposable element-derived protein 4-like [Leptinotarsa decemlineata]
MLGLIYMAGIMKGNKLNLEDLWRKDGYGIEIFHLTMSLQRFRFLLRNIKFDNVETRLEGRALDKLAPIRKLFDLFVSHCVKGYHHSEFVTIDEMLPAFCERCAFRQYMPKKPSKYGIKLFALCDAKMFYTSNLEVYVGTQPEGIYKVSNASEDVVTRMCSHISGSGRNVTMDNWFMSISLVDKLQINFKLTSYGTIKKNRRGLPLQFTIPFLRPPHSSMFGFRPNCTLVSYLPKKNKNILLVSSYHKEDEIDESTNNLNKPVMIRDYNKTKGGVDTVDKLCASYNCARGTRRWPMVVFYLMLNKGGINSQVIFCANNPTINILRRNFLRDLANDLIKPHLAARACLTGLPRILKLRLQEITGVESTAVEVNIPPGRCEECGWRKNRKTRFFCYLRRKYICLEHVTSLCSGCKQPPMEVE